MFEKEIIKRYGALGGVSDSNWGYGKGVLEGVSRTIMAGRNDTAIVCKVARGGLYTNASEDFQRGILKGMARTIKTDGFNGYVAKIEKDNSTKRQTANSSSSEDRIRQIHSGGYERGEIKEKRKNIQKFEPRTDGLTNTITTVLKDNLMIAEVKMENSEINNYLYKDFGVFKLTPRECLRLMGVADSDISKMMSVNSNSQCYKQAGNSIVVPVLMAIFSQLHIKGVKAWNDMTNEERDALIQKNGRIEYDK